MTTRLVTHQSELYLCLHPTSANLSPKCTVSYVHQNSEYVHSLYPPTPIYTTSPPYPPLLHYPYLNNARAVARVADASFSLRRPRLARSAPNVKFVVEKWQWHRYFFGFLSFTLPIPFIVWGMENGPFSGRSSTQTLPHSIATIQPNND
jgi:hypothetical protein